MCNSTCSLPRTMVMVIMVLVVATQLSSSLSSSNYIPCPAWEDGAYLNGKCFKVFPNSGFNWYEAKADCSNQPGTAKLAEPRTREEFELLLSMTTHIAWIGIYTYSGAVQRFASDKNATVEFFGFRDPTDPAGQMPSCMRTRTWDYDVRDIYCGRKSLVRYHFCERNVAERYVLPYAVITAAASPYPAVLEVYLDIVPSRDIVGRQEVVLIHKQIGIIDDTIDNNKNNSYTVLGMSNPGDVRTFSFTNVTRGKVFKSIQPNELEVVTSHSMTLTLWYNRDPVIIRALLYPFLSDIGGTATQEASTRYILASPSPYGRSFVLSVVSKSVEINRVNIIFNDIHQDSSNFIYVDSMYVFNPSGIDVLLKQYHSVNIKGTISLDGTEVTASQEVSVFIIGFEVEETETETSNGLSNPNVSCVQQALPIQTVSNQYVVFLSSELKYDSVYTVVSIHEEMFVTVNEETYYIPRQGSAATKELHLSSNQPFLIYSEKLFKLFKVFNETTTYPDGITKDTCSTPIIPQRLWKTEYSIPILWTYRVDKVHLYLLLPTNVTDDFYLDDTVTPLSSCRNITDIDSHVACAIDLIATSSTSSLIRIRSPQKFGAHLTWVSGNVRGCQILGIDWYGDWQSSPPSSTRQSTNPTTTTTDASSSNQTCTVENLITQSINLTDTEIDEVIHLIQNTLHVEATQTSSFIRSKTSATNVNTSARGLGMGGVAFLVFVIASIVISDVITLCKPRGNRTIRKGMKNNKQKQKQTANENQST